MIEYRHPSIIEAFNMNWKTPEKNSKDVNVAGKILRTNKDTQSQEYKEALRVVDNWRAAHAYPLHVFYMHFKNKYPMYLVAQRLKRLNSIVKN